MIEVLKALFWVIVAGLLRFLGVTRKKPMPYVTTRDGSDDEPEKLPEWKKQAVEKCNYVVNQILSTSDFAEEEKKLIFLITHVMAGLADKPGVVLRCHFQFIPDQRVRVDVVAEDTMTGQPIQTRIKGDVSNVLSLKGRGYLADYIKGLIQYQAEKDQVTAAMRTASAHLKGGNHDPASRPDKD